MPANICAHCGRYMPGTPIRAARNGQSASPPRKYCSAACRSAARARLHGELEEAIRELLAGRGAGASICPSEAARRRFGEDFRRHMEDARRAARRLAHRGVVEIAQKGRPVDPADFRGAVRIRRGPAFAGPRDSRGDGEEHP